MQTLIAPYQNSLNKPPFSAAELLVMAIICFDDISYWMIEILQRICSMFHYYERQALEAFFNQIAGGRIDWDADYKDGLHKLIDGFRDAFFTPTVALAVDDDGGYDHQMPEIARFTATSTAARVFLEQRLHGKRRGTFPFFELPPELRHVIYEMVLGFHRTGFIIWYGQAELVQHPDEVDSPLEQHGVERCLSLEDTHIAALLRVSRQVHQEAASILYSNTFDFRDFLSYNDFVTGKNPSTILQLRASIFVSRSATKS